MIMLKQKNIFSLKIVNMHKHYLDLKYQVNANSYTRHNM